MKTKLYIGVVGAFLLALLISACGGGNQYHQVPVQQVAYDDTLYESALCVNQLGIRVLDENCRQAPEVGYAGGYGWLHHDYHAWDNDVEVVYVGQPVDRRVYLVERNPRVSTLHIDRGRFPSYPPPGVTATSVKVSSLPVATKKSTVERGGFGAPGAKATGTPIVPARGLSSPAPGRVTTPAPAAPKATYSAPKVSAPSYKAPVKVGK